MKRILLCLMPFVAALFWQGCASRPVLSLTHDIDVPKQFRAGNFSVEHGAYDMGNSTVERYVASYEQGWAIAVQRYAMNIDFDDPSPLMGSGWVEEVDGLADGYADGCERIQLLVRKYGKHKVSEYLHQFSPMNL